ncbi:hypothetical protein KC343_g19822 [Hortaea werneckii]|nr:hypothetical protein KC352_g36926 [Hortaea werneckii]KAI7531219.1 hypothetical protein KC317_g19852 [Hortaea werneckii]KAI7577091.1 hypothetical protein KC346_g19638 [Hortaea werneckii]KAI7584361.1 hypothetical protein KC343_g19822 [Hortaea werneckii]KAI7616604.1 hypothetical protein KC319_g19472 [Hortaea werneckii]
MIHQMLDQFSEHWPHAANFEGTVRQLQNSIASLQGRIETIEQVSTQLESEKTAGDALSLAHGAAGDIEMMRQTRLSKLKGNAIEGDASPKTSFAEKERLATIEKKLAQMQENLDAFETNGQSHQPDNGVAEQDLRELRAKIDNLESEAKVIGPRVETHDALLQEGQKWLSKAQGEIKALILEAGKVKGRLEELEEEYLR